LYSSITALITSSSAAVAQMLISFSTTFSPHAANVKTVNKATKHAIIFFHFFYFLSIFIFLIKQQV
jgi:hypothetical protein